MTSLLQEHLLSHPAAEVRDGVKFLYQRQFGGGHMIQNPTVALTRLNDELAACGDGNDALWESLGNGLCRLNLRAIRGKVSPETVNAMFIHTANTTNGSVGAFEESLSELYLQRFSRKSLDAYFTEYKTQGYPPVSHSEAYRRTYRPAYRVVFQRCVDFFPLFCTIDKLLARATAPVIVAIDGDCGSGKSTLGKLLQDIYNGNLFHADDYFLPPDLRTTERLAQPGGNMHRERLCSEVLEPLSIGNRAVTRRFDCASCTLFPPVRHPEKALNIVEGSYCLHPTLRSFYTLRIFLQTTPERQRERIITRSSSAAWERFKALWIPLEKTYFSVCAVEDCADMVFET